MAGKRLNNHRSDGMRAALWHRSHHIVLVLRLNCVSTILVLPGMCTVHANSAREAVTKMCTLPLLAGENVSHAFVVPTVASCIDLVVQVATERDGRRAVREIVAVPGRVEGDVVETADVFTTRGGALVRAEGWPPHLERFEQAGFDVARLLSPYALETV